MKLLLSGLPGRMHQVLIPRLLSEKLELCEYALTSERNAGKKVEFSGRSFELLGHAAVLERLKQEHTPLFAIDFSKPAAALTNVEFFCQSRTPFVMGTTGVDRNAAVNLVMKSAISAVIAPNMAIPVIVLQAMIEFAANTYPHALEGYNLKITESHQKAKVDKSGTGVAIGQEVTKLGVTLAENDFVSIRDPQQQKKMGIPDSALDGHGYHDYRIESPDGTHEITFGHNIRGRDVYVAGVLKALGFLKSKCSMGTKGVTYSMRDVIENK
jgi:4-hydroxy-tetrahydrodipicolinate reductase